MELDGMEVLSERQCRSLLSQERVGRVAVAEGGLATVFPVNYSLVSDEILFFTGEGTKLRAATMNARVTFEVDHIDPFSQAGWSVLVVGLAREVTEPVVIAGALASGPRPWARGDRARLIALTIQSVSGRRIMEVLDLREPDVLGSGMIGPQSPVSSVARRPVRVGSDWSLQAAAHTMCQANVSSVLVDPDTAIVTERDLTQALSAGLDPGSAVTAVSVTDLVSVDQETTVVEAAGEMLRHEIRHLVVCNHRGDVTGMVTLRDVMRILVEAMDPAVWVVLRQSLSVGTSFRLV